MVWATMARHSHCHRSRQLRTSLAAAAYWNQAWRFACVSSPAAGRTSDGTTGLARSDNVGVFARAPSLARRGGVPALPHLGSSPPWSQERWLSLPLFWSRTRARLDPNQVAAEIGWLTIPSEPLDTSAPTEP